MKGNLNVPLDNHNNKTRLSQQDIPAKEEEKVDDAPAVEQQIEPEPLPIIIKVVVEEKKVSLPPIISPRKAIQTPAAAQTQAAAASDLPPVFISP